VVFCNVMARAQDLSNRLNREGWASAYFAGGQLQEDRNLTMKSLRDFNLRILVSTDLIARGIDIDRVNLVVNMDMPKDHETYLHRIGRTGRFGTYGVAVSFITQADMAQIEAVCQLYNTQISPLDENEEIPVEYYTYQMQTETESKQLEKLITEEEKRMKEGESFPSILPKRKESTPKKDKSYKKPTKEDYEEEYEEEYYEPETENKQAQNNDNPAADYSQSNPYYTHPSGYYNYNYYNPGDPYYTNYYNNYHYNQYYNQYSQDNEKKPEDEITQLEHKTAEMKISPKAENQGKYPIPPNTPSQNNDQKTNYNDNYTYNNNNYSNNRPSDISNYTPNYPSHPPFYNYPNYHFPPFPLHYGMCCCSHVRPYPPICPHCSHYFNHCYHQRCCWF